jgi:hypothetical protein
MVLVVAAVAGIRQVHTIRVVIVGMADLLRHFNPELLLYLMESFLILLLALAE